MNNPLQLLLVTETSGEDKTDVIYINEVIKYFFDTSGVNVQWITLGGKTHYKDKKIESKIKNLEKMFKSYNKDGKTVTIYFVDTDSIEKDYKQGSFFKNLCDYIKEKGYELVWFCKNSENVFLYREPDSLTNKTEEAKNFAIKGGINGIGKDKLSKMAIELNCSNILIVLSKYLPEKDN
ncbi:MAG: hypothetical protein J5955_06540 [Bacilli bacterium]|nr:hypothetical protein [Bacilli bacterium]